jgi:hypothetical protein
MPFLRFSFLENNRIEPGVTAIGMGKKGKVKISSPESLGAGELSSQLSKLWLLRQNAVETGCAGSGYQKCQQRSQIKND